MLLSIMMLRYHHTILGPTLVMVQVTRIQVLILAEVEMSSGLLILPIRHRKARGTSLVNPRNLGLHTATLRSLRAQAIISMMRLLSCRQGGDQIIVEVLHGETFEFCCDMDDYANDISIDLCLVGYTASRRNMHVRLCRLRKFQSSTAALLGYLDDSKNA